MQGGDQGRERLRDRFNQARPQAKAKLDEALRNFNAPEQASRPFDKEREGFVFAEGGGSVILETEEHARARGAHIYAEVLGGAMTGDAYHVTAPAPGGAAAK